MNNPTPSGEADPVLLVLALVWVALEAAAFLLIVLIALLLALACPRPAAVPLPPAMPPVDPSLVGRPHLVRAWEGFRYPPAASPVSADPLVATLLPIVFGAAPLPPAGRLRPRLRQRIGPCRLLRVRVALPAPSTRVIAAGTLRLPVG